MSTKVKRNKPKIPRAYGPGEGVNQKVEMIPFTGAMFDAFNTPQNKGRWFIWGNSGSGKSTFVMQLAKEFARHTSVFYNNLEEYKDEIGWIERIERCRMQDVKPNIKFQSYNQEQMDIYLCSQKSPKVVIIDSATYFWNNRKEYEIFRDRWRHKIVIVVGHADGSKPDSTLEEIIHRDASMKIFVEGYMATCKGRRPGPKGTHIIWYEGYHKIHGTKYTDFEDYPAKK